MDERSVVRLLVEVLDGYSREGSYPATAHAVVARGLHKAGMRPGLLDDALATLAAQDRA